MGRSTQKAENKELTAEMRARALQLRKDGHSYEAIGVYLAVEFAHRYGKNSKSGNFSSTYAKKLVDEAIRSIYREDAKTISKLELERLDAMQLEVLNVLRAKHYITSGGQVVRDYLRDEHGNCIVDRQTGQPLIVALEDDAPRLAAVDRLLRIQERRAKLLGLDKPTKVAPTNPDGDKPASPFVIVATPEDQKI